MSPGHSRRAFLTGAGSAVTAALAGCSGSPVTTEPDTLRVGTYASYIDAPSTSAGEYVKAEFEDRTDYTLEWVVPDGELNHFIQRRQEDVSLEADAFLGVTPQDLIRADTNLDESLFEGFQAGSIPNGDNVEDIYRFDPEQRILPTGASYVAIVYDESAVDEPGSFEALTDPGYEGELLLSNPAETTTGLLFLLWTVHTLGEDSFLDYWSRAMENDVRILGSWGDAYNAYLQEEASMVVSYSTDQVFAAEEGQDMARHRIAFPNDQGYAYVDGVGKFTTTERGELVDRFAEFMLDPEVQQETAVQNVGIPTVSNASLPEEFQQYAHVPADPVQLPYETLKQSMNDWRDAWSTQVASR